MAPLEGFNGKRPGKRPPKKTKFKPTLGGFEESPQEEELDKQEQQHVAEEAKKPKVPKRTNGGLGFSQVVRRRSSAPNLPTIYEADEGQQGPDQTPKRKDNSQGKSR